MLCSCACAAVWGQGDAPSDDQAAIERVLQRYHEVSGGVAAETQVQSRVLSSSYQLQGLVGQVIVHEKAPDRVVRMTILGGIGSTISGFDGKTAWEWSTADGYTELTGEAAAAARAGAQMHARFGSRAQQRRWLGRDTVDGRAVEKIELVTDGVTTVASFDRETGLLVSVEEDGTTVTFSDFRQVGPEKIAFSEKDSRGIDVTVHLVRQNVPLDDRYFVPRRQGVHAWMPDGAGGSISMALTSRLREAIYHLGQGRANVILRMLPPAIIRHLGGEAQTTQLLQKHYGPQVIMVREVEFHEEGGRVWAVVPIEYNEKKDPDQRAVDIARLSMIVLQTSPGEWRFVPAWLLRDWKARQLLPAIPIKVEEMLDALEEEAASER